LYVNGILTIKKWVVALMVMDGVDRRSQSIFSTYPQIKTPAEERKAALNELYPFVKATCKGPCAAVTLAAAYP